MNMPEYYLSVDGGGTKTAFLLQSGDGTRTIRARSGPASIKSVGETAARENLAAGLEELWRQAGFGPEGVAHSVFGLSGCDSVNDERTLANVIETLGFPAGQYTLCNDAVLAFYAAAEPPGMVLIAGTGSIVVGVDSRGNFTRAGGWGYGFSDLGSGYWLGCRALQEALRYCDGCGPWAPWFPEVAKVLGAESLDRLTEAAADINQCDQVAALAKVLLTWPEPDSLGNDILEQGSRFLAELLVACDQKIAHMPGETPHLVLAGGCMGSARYADMVTCRLPARLRDGLTAEVCEPVQGGIRLAKRAAEKTAAR